MRSRGGFSGALASSCVGFSTRSGAARPSKRATKGANGMGSGRAERAEVGRSVATVLAPAGKFSTNLLWDRAIAEDRLYGVAFTGQWYEVGTPQHIRPTEEALKGG